MEELRLRETVDRMRAEVGGDIRRREGVLLALGNARCPATGRRGGRRCDTRAGRRARAISN